MSNFKKLFRSAVKFVLIPGVILMVISLVLFDQWTRDRYGASLHQLAGRYLPAEIAWQREQRPSLTPILNVIEALIPEDNRYIYGMFDGAPAPIWADDWQNEFIGTMVNKELPPPAYDLMGRPMPSELNVESPSTARPEGERVYASSSKEIVRAIRYAEPGQIITITPGTYKFKGHNITVKNGGNRLHPITIRASRLGQVRLQFDLLEGLYVGAPYWVFENLEIEGVCKNDSRCEHAFHIVGGGAKTIIRNNVIKNFNAHFKINGNLRTQTYPDDGLVEYNIIIDDRLRKSGNPASPIDVVGASGWIFRRNFIADFGKENGWPSYAGFFKGGGSSNLFEQNVILCEFRHFGGVRVGLSFGDGGTGVNLERPGTRGTEQYSSAMRNNLIANCPRDVGIYISKSKDITLSGNMLVNTVGIDVRFPVSNAVLTQNSFDGRVLSRDGAVIREEDSLGLDSYRFNAKFDFQRSDIMELLSADLPYARPDQGTKN